MEEKIEIPVSKTKIIVLLIASLAFVFLGAWILLATDANLFYKIIAFVGILFFGLGLFAFPPKLLDRTSGMIIDKFGITDNMTKPRVGTLEWGDISHVEISSIGSSKMLLIFVHQLEKYLDRVKGYTHRGLRNNCAMVGTPFVIPSSLLKIKLEVLESIINSKLTQYASKP